MEIVAPLIGLNWTLLMVLATFFVLYLIVKKFFFEKIRDFMQAREQKVKDQFDNAEAANILAEKHLAEYKEKLENIEHEKLEMLKETRILADHRAQEIVKEAHARASEIVKKAEKEAEWERDKLAEEMREQVAMLAIYTAEKIIEKQLDEESQMLLIDEIIEQNDGETWKN